mmetsp:Transcript_82619/g.212839  ORF Transcript_82619/g.212839 Transcript_82619/m.212839 type:complete len:222 (+) Transcript_82619:1001-1666(+)
MTTSPGFISSSSGSGRAFDSAAPTRKPEMSKPLALKTPGISAVFEPSSAQAASMQPFATPSFTSSACLASSFGAARWHIRKSGSAPRAATSFASSATRSTPTVSKRSMAIATLSLVPTLLVLLTSSGFLYFSSPMLQMPARPDAPPSSDSCSQPGRCVFCMSGMMLLLMTLSRDKSTPALRYVHFDGAVQRTRPRASAACFGEAMSWRKCAPWKWIERTAT